MKKHMKRLLSMALVCVMVLGLCGQAFAADTTSDTTADTTADITTVVPSDIEGHWAQAEIQAMMDMGYVNGYKDGTVRPNQPITRAQMMALINRVKGYTEKSDAISNYTDVKEGSWYYDDVSYALAAGYVKGTTATTMNPNGKITRQQAITMLARVLNLDDSDTAILSSFTDSDKISSYAKGSVAGMVAAGYVKGYNDGTIRPGNTITRAQAIVMLYRIITANKTWAQIYSELGVDTTSGYDAVTSATSFTSRHAGDIPAIVHKTTDADGNTTSLDGAVVTGKTAAVTPEPSSTTASYYSYSCSYGDGEFIIYLDDTVEGYVWNEYKDSLYAVTVSNGETTVGAMPWTDFYGESATSGFHYNKVEVALNNGTSKGANAAEITRYAAFYDKNGNVSAGTYTVTLYADGYEPLAVEFDVLPTYNGSVTAAVSNKAVTLTGLPEDIKNATATVTYTVGSGRSAVTTTYADAAAIADGGFTCDEELPAGKTCKVVISSDNYAPITTSMDVPAYYVMKNVSYTDFYASLNDDADVDAVSSATAQKAASCKNVYFAETPEIEGGTTINGVVVPVAVSALAEGETALEETPAFYLEKAATGYTYVAETTTVDNVAASISSNGTWGNYIVMLTSDLGQGTYKSTNRMTGEETDATIMGVLSANVYGAYFTTTDGKQYALKQSENLWTPNDYYEFGIFTVAGSTDIHGAAQPAEYYKSIEGQSIASVTYLTTKGIITANFASALYCAPQYTGEITAALNSTNTTVTVSGLPADAADVKVSVGTAGRGATYLVQDAAIVDGVVTLDTAAVAGTTYTVTVTASNYASMKTTVTAAEVPAEPETVSTTYEGKVTVTPDEDAEFTSYEITAAVTVENDVITAVEVSGYGAENEKYWDYVLNGRTRKDVDYASVPSQLVGKTVSEVTALAGIDAVSGATCSSNALFAAVKAALAA